MSERDAQTVPNPGSDEAIKRGCTCPQMDNGHGRGRGGDGETFGWWITEGCPLHDHSKKKKYGADQGLTGDLAPKEMTE